MESARKFKIIVNSKECGTCSGPTPSAVAKKVVKKLCGTSSKAVRFSLKECKRGCERECGPYQGRMEKLDKPYKRSGKTITHRVVCGKVRKMRGGRVLRVEDFRKMKNYGPFRIEGYGMFKIPYIYFGLILIREESPKHSEFYKYVIYNTKHFGGDVRISRINSETGEVEELIIGGENNNIYHLHDKLRELYDELKKNPNDYKRIQKFIKNKLNNENRRRNEERRRKEEKGEEEEEGEEEERRKKGEVEEEGEEEEEEEKRRRNEEKRRRNEERRRKGEGKNRRRKGEGEGEGEEEEERRKKGKGKGKGKREGEGENNLNRELTVDDFSKNGYIGGFEVKQIGHKYYFFIGESEDTYSLVLISYMENRKEKIEIKMLDGDEIIDVKFDTFARILDTISENDNFNFRTVPDEMFNLTYILKKFYDNMSFHPTKKEDVNSNNNERNQYSNNNERNQYSNNNERNPYSNNNERNMSRKSINPNKGLSIVSYFEILRMLGPYDFITEYILNRRDKLLEHHRAVVANKIAKKFVYDNLSKLNTNNNSNKQLLIDEFLKKINIKQKFKLDTEMNMLMNETDDKAIHDCQRLVMREISILSKKNSLNQIKKQISLNELTGRRRLM